MPLIHKFMNCEKHCRQSEYMIQFRLYGEDGCDFCACVGCTVHTPVTSNNALQNTAISFIPLPRSQTPTTKNIIFPRKIR